MKWMIILLALLALGAGGGFFIGIFAIILLPFIFILTAGYYLYNRFIENYLSELRGIDNFEYIDDLAFIKKDTPRVRQIDSFSSIHNGKYNFNQPLDLS